MRLLSPRLDIVFKLLLLRNRDLLRAQLEAILGRSVIDVEILNPEIPGDLAGDKGIVLDLRVRMDGNERLDVEMQTWSHGFLANRVLYYAARDYGGQLQRGNDYASLTPTVSVLWVNARMFPTCPAFTCASSCSRRSNTSASATNSSSMCSNYPRSLPLPHPLQRPPSARCTIG